MAKSVSIPVQVAGGLRNENIIQNALDFSERVVIGTLAFKDKVILDKLRTTYGNKRIVISVDHKDGLIVVNGWQESTKLGLIDAVKEFVTMGFSEFLSTDVTRDGTLEGPDLRLIQQINKTEGTNVIVSGGISSIDDVAKVKETDSFGVILGKALYENKISIEEAKKIA
jgi:phosphoribosylformimino-5-aminoimidazole carboxamide ribotide isomerase